jgi:hypothetical protein
LALFNSRYDIGDPIEVFNMKGYIRHVLHTNNKVRYNIFLLIEETTIYNVDSHFVEPRQGDKFNFGKDNNS